MNHGLLLLASSKDLATWRAAAAEVAIPIVGEAEPAAALEAYDALRPPIVLLDAGTGEERLQVLDTLLRRDPAAKIIVALPAADQEAPWRPLLAGARDFVITPFGVAEQLTRVHARVFKDNGTPQTFMEELVGWHELGEALLRSGQLSPEDLDRARQAERRGQYVNLFAALESEGLVPRKVLTATLEDVHKTVSAAFLLMKTKRLSMAQLRAAFIVMLRRGSTLRDVLLERGWCTPEDFDRGPWNDPPPGAPAARRPRPGGSGGEAAAG